jgi:hypothetical protein
MDHGSFIHASNIQSDVVNLTNDSQFQTSKLVKIEDFGDAS